MTQLPSRLSEELAETVRDLMATDPPSIGYQDTLREAANVLATLEIGAIPVLADEDHSVGMLAARDVVRAVACGKDPQTTRVHELQLEDGALNADCTLVEAFAAFHNYGLGRLPVVEEGSLVGVVALADIRRQMEKIRDVEKLWKWARRTPAGEQDRFQEWVRRNVGEDISPRDVMARKGGYLQIGLDALRCIRVAMIAARKETADRILDLPCGHGRVLRMLRAAFPEADLAACDIDRDAVDFCARSFGATPIYSSEDPRDIGIEGEFDLIWCGSLLTHLDSGGWPGFLSRFESLLSPGGLLVLSTHGRRVAQRLRSGEKRYGLAEDQIPNLLRRYDRDGFGFAQYSPAENSLAVSSYGISVASPDWVCDLLGSRPNLQLVIYSEGQWAQTQDIVGCVPVEG
jgi:CBS domain-containing protein/SAM-dependent methyltransferase